MPFSDRFHLALDDMPALPKRALFLRAAPGGLTETLGTAALTCEQGFRPAHDALAARGFRVAPVVTETGFPLVAVHATPSREETLGLVARGLAALAPEGTLLLSADKAEGADSLLKNLRENLPVAASWSKAHGRLIRIDAPARAPEGWASALTPGRNRDGWLTAPGMFSPGHADPGSVLLARAVQGRLKGRIADLGAGWGFLAATALADNPAVGEIHLIEAEHAALACAKANVTDQRVRFHWADALTFSAESGFDALLCNPPFHSGKTTEPGIGAAFIAAAARLLAPRGTVWIVANSHLPYEAALRGAFTRIEALPRQAGYKIFAASQPRRR